MRGIARLKDEAFKSGWSVEEQAWGPKGYPQLIFRRPGERIEAELYASRSRVRNASIYRGDRCIHRTAKHTEILIFLRVPMKLANYQEAAFALMRKAAEDHLPVDAGLVGMLAEVVADAYQAGEERAEARFHAAIQEVLTAHAEYLDTDNHDVLRDALTELMELLK